MNKKKILAWILFLLWLVVIFFFSSQNGQSSSDLSNGLLNFLEEFTRLPLINEFFSFLIRKLAHFTEYLILGILSCNLVKQYRSLNKMEYLAILLFCITYAISDEVHQMFVNGRSPQVFDVFVDSLGSSVGIFLIYIMTKVKKNKNF